MELDPLLMPMPWHALADHQSFGHIEGGEQRGRPIAFVVVRHRATATGHNWRGNGR